jgi:hypothetical protein
MIVWSLASDSAKLVIASCLESWNLNDFNEGIGGFPFPGRRRRLQRESSARLSAKK